MDEPDETFTISWGLQAYSFFDSNTPNCPYNSQCLTTFTITDDDPTVVSIARVGSGAVTEGGRIEFTVTLGRALVAGETIDVPLSIGGTNVTAGDWRLALKPGAANTGVAPRIGNVVRFSGAGARTATLELTAVDDGTADHNEAFSIALGADADFDDADLGTNVGGGADPHSTNSAFSVTVNDPPPSVSLHPSDPIGVEGGNNSASVELRLRRALTSGESLTVTYSLDLNAGASESDNGVTLSHTAGHNSSAGTLTVTGPNAPQNITLQLSPAANTVWQAGMRAREFKLTGVSGVDGAGISGTGSTKVFVNDSAVSRTTSMQVSGGPPLASHHVEEGREVWLLLDGKAGRKRNSGPRPYDWHNVTVGVQNLTTGFNDLGEAYAGHDAFVGHLRREGDTDYYNVGVLGYRHSAQMRIPILSDGVSEGDERFRVFIAETERTYMGVEGAYNALDRAPAVEFTIRGRTGGPQRSPSEAPPPPQAPTQAVSNVRVAAVDANNAEAAWDAVEHATGYEVAWDALDGDGQSIAGGLSTGVAGTSETIAHHAPGAASLEVTVAPQYVDGNGDTQTLDGLAGTATLDLGSTGNGAGNGDSVGDGGTGGGEAGTGNPPPASSCVGDAQWGTVAGYYKSNAGKAPKYGSNWYRVLIAYRLEDADRALPAWTGPTAEPTAAFTVKEAEDGEKVWGGWTPVRKVLECLRDAKLISRSFAPLVPAASNPAREGVVRIANRSPWAGSVRIAATDDAGWRPEPLTLLLGPGASVDLTSADLERGSPSKGLSGGTGPGTGDWRLTMSSDSAIHVRTHVRSADGRLAAMDAVAPLQDGVHQVAVLHPADDARRTGLLRLVNRGSESLAVRVTAIDDAGASPGGAVSMTLPARAAAMFTAAALERGGAGLDGALGDGHGMWRLRIVSDGPLAAMALAEEAGGHLANLSDPAPAARLESGVHAVAGFPSAYGPAGRPGTLRIVNDSAAGGTVTIRPHDAQGRALGPARLRLGPGQAANLDAWDLELGNPAKGLSGGAGPARGDWRIEVESDLDLRVLPLVRTPAGLPAAPRGRPW